ASRDHGGRMASGRGTIRPLRKLRLSSLGASLTTSSSVWRARRAEDDLPHPDEEAVAADDGHRQDRPDQDGENDEGGDFLAPRRRFCRRRNGRILPIRHDARVLRHSWNVQKKGPLLLLLYIG